MLNVVLEYQLMMMDLIFCCAIVSLMGGFSEITETESEKRT